MAKIVLIDEFHLSVFVPRGLPAAEYGAMKRILNNASFHTRLRAAVQDVFRHYPSLNKVRVTLTR